MEKDKASGPIIDSVALKALNTPKRSRGNMLKNGNFEEGPYIFPKTSWGALITPNIEDDHSPLLGWMIDYLKAVKYIDSDHFMVPEDEQAVELVAGRESALTQVVKTLPGKKYELFFSIGDSKKSHEGSMVVEASAGKIIGQFHYESKSNGGFKLTKLRFVAMSSRTRIIFLSTFYHMKIDSSLCDPVIDDVRLVSVLNPRRG